MNKTTVILFLMVFALPLFGQQDIHDIYSLEYSKKIIYDLSDTGFNGRGAGTKWGKKSAAYVKREFQKAGYDVCVQKISDAELDATIGNPKNKVYPKMMRNVIAVMPGRDLHRYVVVGAHYDHLGNTEAGIHPGADDNASGIATILTLAKMVRASGITPEYTLVFCAWDGEEKGLLGSKYYVQRWFDNREEGDSICCYINFDMVGRSDNTDIPSATFAWNDNYPFLLDICKEAQSDIPQPFNVMYDRRTGDGKGGSDYAPFSAHDIPFIAWMEDELHVDYHKPTDTPDKIHWEKHRKLTILSYEVLVRLLKK